MSGLESMSTLVPLLVSPEAAILIKDATRHFLNIAAVAKPRVEL